MQVMREMRIPLPKAFATATELIVGTDLSRELGRDELDFEEIQRLVEETKRWSLELDKKSLGFVAIQKINSLMKELHRAPDRVALFEIIEGIFRVLSDVDLQLDLWEAQNIYFSMGKEHYSIMEERAAKGDQAAQRWLKQFKRLGDYLHVKSS